MKPPRSNAPRVLAPMGTHKARVIGLIYIGTIATEFKGEKKELYKVRLTWELPEELHAFRPDEPSKPYVVSKEYTFSMGKKANLRPIVEGIIGTSLLDEEAFAFDLDQIVGKECLLSISHEEGEIGKYVSVNSTSPLLRGMTCPPQINPTKVLSYQKWDESVFDSLPDFLKAKIESSKEYNLKLKLDPLRNHEAPKIDDEVNPDDIPF